MRKIFIPATLTRTAIKSSPPRLTMLFYALLVALVAALAAPLAAHEVQPAIGDLTLENGTARLDLRLNAEAILAGIDLDDIEDTNQTAQSSDYDDLRLLPAPEINTRLQTAWPGLTSGLVLSANGAELSLTLENIEASEIGDTSVSRPTRVQLVATLPAGADRVTLAWPDGFGSLILRHIGVADGYTGYLSGGDVSPEIALAGGAGQTAFGAFVDYIPVGFDHILPKGLDHILFVLGLFFLSPAIGALLWQVSAFTLAHTVTLALGALGMVNVPGAIVEPLIAASIAFVAFENLVSGGKLHRWRPVVIFGFGLLHGLGFASVLGEFGLPDSQFIPALLGFNVGVELGQLTVIALAFLAVGAWFRRATWYRSAIAMPASAVIGCVGIYWFVERAFL